MSRILYGYLKRERGREMHIEGEYKIKSRIYPLSTFMMTNHFKIDKGA